MPRNRNEYGRVIAINQKRGMVAVSIEDTGISVFNVVDCYDFQLNDIVYGPLDYVGGQTIFHPAEKYQVQVFIEATGCTEKNFRHYMLS
ncbi:hypothetical protein L9G74_18945 [Shewanella sp. C32]|uniref:Uncharacterized protein n=1 Tax=Shewanella electrica TaxID=515560 RepID=A0ABT2FQB4_9GAMM|nr:hypothetical protein [Shewanella electrica]MCH1926893.1 hypothetical protein [Shewanella electrica]MCS4558517.1 hypothetical protein [Shewanella electrica]